MEKSHYLEYINKFLKGIVLNVIKKLNGKEDGMPPRYRFKEMLTPKFSVTGKWESVISTYRNVKADIVSMDSPLPLKSRPSLGGASGDIPKSGMRKWLNETQMTALQTMEAMNEAKEVVKELFKDAIACITGMYENMEYLFLLGLSTGEALVTDEENVGTGTRLKYGYLDENKFKVEADWSNPVTANPLDDIERMVDKSKGSIRVLMMDRKTANLLRNSEQAKSDVAGAGGAVVIDGSKAKRPSLSALNEYLTTEFGLIVDVVERSIEAEKDGKPIELTPWKAGMIIGLPNYNVGDLVYARTAEENANVAGVTYQKPDDWMLLSMFRKNEPAVSEHTRIQGRVFPVITNVGKIYQLDTTEIGTFAGRSATKTSDELTIDNFLGGNGNQVKAFLKTATAEDLGALIDAYNREVDTANGGQDRKGVKADIEAKVKDLGGEIEPIE